MLGLHYAQQRYYDASLGRWLSQDPIGFDGGLNLYAGMGNNPVTMVDPEGLNPGEIINTVRDHQSASMTTMPSEGYRPQSDCGSSSDWINAAFDFLAIVGMASLILEASPFVGLALIRGGLGRYGMPILANSFRLQELSPLALLGLTRGRGQQARVGGQEAVFGKPSTLAGTCPNDVSKVFRGSGNWQVTPLGHGRNKGSGLSIREKSFVKKGKQEYTDRYIQWHPGTQRHHNGKPYWKVSAGKTGANRDYLARPGGGYAGGYDTP